jgi:hypothetical protein
VTKEAEAGNTGTFGPQVKVSECSTSVYTILPIGNGVGRRFWFLGGKHG